jgi:hypothetical protein
LIGNSDANATGAGFPLETTCRQDHDAYVSVLDNEAQEGMVEAAVELS